jgi:hypothetical protein
MKIKLEKLIIKSLRLIIRVLNSYCFLLPQKFYASVVTSFSQN